MATIKLTPDLLDRLAQLEETRGSGNRRAEIRAWIAFFERITNHMSGNKPVGYVPEPLSDEDAAQCARLGITLP